MGNLRLRHKVVQQCWPASRVPGSPSKNKNTSIYCQKNQKFKSLLFFIIIKKQQTNKQLSIFYIKRNYLLTCYKNQRTKFGKKHNTDWEQNFGKHITQTGINFTMLLIFNMRNTFILIKNTLILIKNTLKNFLIGIHTFVFIKTFRRKNQNIH